jgi:predicted phosphohydrolase
MLYAIADIHLSLGVENKNMSIFKGWENHGERLFSNWNNSIGGNDVAVIAGDVSWGKTLEESLPDFEFISKLNGTKIILKGNHDYWWNTDSKMRGFLSQNKINDINFLNNNAYRVGDVAVCGTRGWIGEGMNSMPCDEKILLREARRLEASVKAGLELGGEIVVFLHCPPIHAREENSLVIEVLKKYSIKRVFSGHIHSSGMNKAFIGEKYGVYFDIITSDYLNFSPKKIL